MAFRSATAADLGRLYEIWLAAILMTHGFLNDDARAEIGAVVKNDYLPNAEFEVYADSDDRPLGFMGCSGNNIDALFIDPAEHGKGIGRQFIDRMKAEFPRLTVQVNEQQPQAHAFYRSCGFTDIRRDPVDDAGRPFPTVHMEWRR
ncbi:acetyltransferase [Kordiimonas aestuarii]|uniref:acetyltransferase n=1 Tax=Kordiimonas aestuarii TaxID=1005925 RepID=UPI0021D28B06|nr:acetyltransferase [Kordiimonas aestuarii]